VRARSINAAAFILSGKGAAEIRDRLALVSVTEELTYGELLDRVSRFAAALRERGLGRGDRCVLLMLDTPDLVAMALAVMAAGGVTVLVPPRADVLTLREVVAIAHPFALLADDHFAATADDALGVCSDVVLLTARDLAAWKRRPHDPFDPVETTAGEPAFWVVSSGTTGRPKAVEHRHDNVRSCTDYFSHVLGVTSSDRVFATSRLHFAYALGTALFGSLSVGATTVLLEASPTASSVGQTVQRFAPTAFFSVPTMYHKLIESDACSALGFRSVRLYVSAGERLALRIAGRWEAATGRPILDGMGCSETVYMIFGNAPAAHCAGSSGRPVGRVEVRLVDAQGKTMRGPRAVGALHVRMASLCSGYRTGWRAGGEPAARPQDRFRDGWFDTGDEYRIDDEGFYHHCGRTDDMLRVAGKWVSPAEIEDALDDVEEVGAAAAVAAASLGDLAEIVLYLVAASGVGEREAVEAARSHLARALPSSKRPRRFVAVGELPRTATGKLQRHKLRALSV
jgi:acyl-coenzyme A synthetase/AMP-(fatty) acid ligase